MSIQLRTPDEELGLLKTVFADNDNLLRILRNLFMGVELSAEEKQAVIAIPVEVKKIVRKRFTGEFDKSTLVGQTSDPWAGIEVLGKTPEFIFQIIKAREQLIELVKRAMELLDDPNKKLPELTFHSTLLDNDPWAIGFLARAGFLQQVDGQLSLIKVIVGTKSETVEQAKKRLQADSSK